MIKFDRTKNKVWFEINSSFFELPIPAIDITIEIVLSDNISQFLCQKLYSKFISPRLLPNKKKEKCENIVNSFNNI